MAPKAQRRSSAATTASQAGRRSSNEQEEHHIAGASGLRAVPRPRAVARMRGRHTAADECCTAAPGRQGSNKGQYWQARHPCPLFAGPLGEVVGQVECGTVIAEQARYEDRFGGWWLATRAEDGSLVWVSYNAAECGELGTQYTQPPHWQRVIDERTAHEAHDDVPLTVQQAVVYTETAVTKSAHSEVGYEGNAVRDGTLTVAHAMTPETLASLAGLGGDADVPSWIDLYDYYWTTAMQVRQEAMLSDGNGSPASSGRLSESLNVRYQAALERLLWLHDDDDGDNNNKATAEARLQEVVHEFESEAKAAAVCVVEDLLRPASARVTRPHATYRHVFYYGALVVWLCIDTTMGLYGGERGAEKAATHAFRSYQLFALTAPRRLLSVPLLAHVTFAGYTMLVSSVPPVARTTCVYAPLRAALSVSHDTQDNVSSTAPPRLVERLIGEVAAMLHLAPHDVTVSGTTWRALLPADVEVYVGRDRRLYVLNVARILPPLLPLIRDHTGPTAATTSVEGASSVELSLHGMRPELLLLQGAASGVLLSPDVGLRVKGDGCASSEDAVRAACHLAEVVRQDIITSVAGMLGLVLPVLHPTPRVAAADADENASASMCCTLCQRALDDGDEMCFVVCRNVHQCCRICVHCYGARTAAAHHPAASSAPAHAGQRDEGALGLDENHLHDAVRCEAAPRPINGCLLEPSICSLLHRSGLSLCHLPYVYYRLPTASAALVGRYCELEMLARAARRVLQERLRRCACTAQDALRVVEQFFVTLLQPGGQETERLWSEEVGLEMRRSFPAIVVPFDTTTLSPLLLVERLQALCGVTLTKSSLASLQSSVGTGNAFVQVSQIQPRVKPLPQYWTTSPECCSDNPDQWLRDVLEDVLLFWIAHAPADCDDTAQPFYLREAMTL